jgi:predicted ATPase
MISSLRLENFKAFERASLDLRPITVLLGPNNSGKSSIMASLRLLVQTVESFDSSVPLLLNGILGDFGTYKDIVYQNHRGKKIEIELDLTPLKRRATWGLGSGDVVQIKLAFKFRTGRREIILKNFELRQNGSVVFSSIYSEEAERQIVNHIGSREVPQSLRAALSRAMRVQNFIPQNLNIFTAREVLGSIMEGFMKGDTEQSLRSLSRLSSFIGFHLRDTEYVGAMRVPPARTYLYTGERRGRIGANGENASNILVLDNSRGKSKSKDILGKIGLWLSSSGMASGIKIETLSDRHYEIKVQHPITKEYQNFADVGFGHSQVLPVLVGGYNLNEGATYLVEQPEIHLHPKAQAELGNFFLELYGRGVQVLLETHSEHLILRLQRHVAAGVINPKDIVFYYVHADGDRKCLVKMNTDGEGKFVNEWPGGFFPERLEEAKELARARFLRSDRGN